LLGLSPTKPLPPLLPTRLLCLVVAIPLVCWLYMCAWYCTIGSYYWTNSVFVKHILLHISGSWPIRVRFLHPWALWVLDPDISLAFCDRPYYTRNVLNKIWMTIQSWKMAGPSFRWFSLRILVFHQDLGSWVSLCVFLCESLLYATMCECAPESGAWELRRWERASACIGSRTHRGVPRTLMISEWL